MSKRIMMITAIAVLLALQTLAARPVEGLDLLAETPFPERFNRSVFGAVPGKGESHAIVFSVSVLEGRDSSKPLTFRYDPAAKVLQPIDGILSRGQIDANLGLAAVEAPDHKATRVLDVASGRTVASIDAPISRYGVLGVEILPPEDNSENSRLFDVRSGEVLRMISKNTRGDFYIGEPAWDDGNVRMFARQATKPGGGWTAGVDLIKMRGRTFDVEASIALFRSYLGFDRIIGDPSKNTFAVAYSTNRRVFYKTFSNALQETKFQVDHVLDVSDYGVLGRMITKEQEYVDPELGPIGCWNPHTGEKLWQVDDKWADRAVWLRSCALVGKQLRHPRTGKVIAEVPPNRVLVASSGITLWTLTVGANQKLEIWRLR